MNPRGIHQILPTLTTGDAIGNHVLELQRLFRGWGCASEIFAERWHPALAQACRPYAAYRTVSGPDNLLINHYSIGGEVNRFVQGLPDRQVLYYHNITPAHFFYPYNAELALQLDDARRELSTFARRIPAIAASDYNRRELEALGFNVLAVVPYLFALRQHAAAPADGLEQQAAALARRYSRPGAVCWLHVGRLAPNKCIHDIIKAFYYFHRWINPNSRLLLVGSGTGLEAYVDELYRLVTQLRLDGAVAFTGPAEQPAAFFRLADLYLAMSEHEGFCIPLIEAMQHNVPVVAFAATAVPDTLGGAGVLIRRKVYPVVAEVAQEVISNPPLRARLTQRQQARLAEFSAEQAQADLRACLERLAQG